MITQEELKSRLNYNKETGVFTWASVLPRSGAVVGERAGSLDKYNGYMRIKLNKKVLLLHRLAWLYEHGSLPEEFIDHINGQRADNRLSNLRLATRAENKRNQKIQSNNTVGYKGVCYRKDQKVYRASCGVNGVQYEIGGFKTAEEAHMAYVEFAKKHHGEFFRAR